MNEQPDLIERLKQAAADDRETIRELFLDAAEEIWGTRPSPFFKNYFYFRVHYGNFNEAAPMLVPKGYNVALTFSPTKALCTVWHEPLNKPPLRPAIRAKTPATALAAASLAAWRAMKGGG
jgi:hypothetical protein